MTTPLPNIPPLPAEAFSEEQVELAQGRQGWTFVRVMVQAPSLYRAYMPFGDRLMSGSDLPHRDREIITLRTLALCRETYDLNHHVHIGRRVGLSDAEIEAAMSGGPSLEPFEQALVRAAEELAADHCVSEATWAVLAERYSRAQLMELVFVAGNYAMLAMATKSFGMRIEDDY